MKEKIYDLTLSIKNPNVPFAVERSIGVQSGSLIETFSRFQLELIRLLKELNEEEMLEIRKKLHYDDIPF